MKDASLSAEFRGMSALFLYESYSSQTTSWPLGH